MIYNLRLGHGFIWASKIYNIDCPNTHGGIGNCTVKGKFWTGDIWMYGEFTIPFGSITTVENRSNLDETDEPWILMWQRPEKFAYQPWFDLAEILR